MDQWLSELLAVPDTVAPHQEELIPQMTYPQVLAKVEAFMIASGIRDYCTKVCQGKCCCSCYEKNPKSCAKTDGRRLACSVFLCIQMKERFRQLSGFSAFEALARCVVDGIARLHYRYANPYFNPPTRTQLKKFSLDAASIESVLSDALALEMKMIVARFGKRQIVDYHSAITRFK